MGIAPAGSTRRLRDRHNDHNSCGLPRHIEWQSFNSEIEKATKEGRIAIWYAMLREKAMSNSTMDLKYITSPPRLVNGMRSTGLESPLLLTVYIFDRFRNFHGCYVFCANDESSDTAQPTDVNVYDTF